jgi:hypothetical protein
MDQGLTLKKWVLEAHDPVDYARTIFNNIRDAV